jgi:hypothetical protein
MNRRQLLLGQFLRLTAGMLAAAALIRNGVVSAAVDQLRTSKVGAAMTGFAETGHSSRMTLPD